MIRSYNTRRRQVLRKLKGYLTEIEFKRNQTLRISYTIWYFLVSLSLLYQTSLCTVKFFIKHIIFQWVLRLIIKIPSTFCHPGSIQLTKWGSKFPSLIVAKMYFFTTLRRPGKQCEPGISISLCILWKWDKVINQTTPQNCPLCVGRKPDAFAFRT